MPIYEYLCEHCDHKMELFQKTNDALLRKCPQCQQEKLRKLISAAAFQLKGTGWYETDFKGKKNQDNKEQKPTDKKDNDKSSKKEVTKESNQNSKKEASTSDSASN